MSTQNACYKYNNLKGKPFLEQVVDKVLIHMKTVNMKVYCAILKTHFLHIATLFFTNIVSYTGALFWDTTYIDRYRLFKLLIVQETSVSLPKGSNNS